MAEAPARASASPDAVAETNTTSPGTDAAKEHAEDTNTSNGNAQNSSASTTNSAAKRRSPTPNDSEAETDILSASNTNTPAKRSVAARDSANEAPPRSAKKAVKVEDGADEENEVRRRHRSTPSTTKKRKISHEVHDDQSGVRDTRHASEGSAESFGVKGRHSPASEGKSGQARASSSVASAGKPTRRQNEKEGTEDRTLPKRPSDLDLSITTNRTAHGDSRTRSESPLHPLHKRTPSYYSSAQDRERRLRPRRGSPDNERTAPETPSHSHFPAMAKAKDVDKHGRTFLARACAEGDSERVRQILGQTVDDLDKPDYAGNTPLQIASLDGSTDIVRMLVEKGANVHCSNVTGDTPLIDAVENSHIDVIKILLNAGVDPQRRGHLGKMPLDVLPKGEHRKAIRDLLQAAIKTFDAGKAPEPAAPIARRFMTEKELHLITPSIDRLREYSANGDINASDRMIQNGVKPDNSCLVAAAKGGHADLLSLLLAEGGVADPNPLTLRAGETTPLLAAIGRGVPDVITLLVEYPGFDVRRKVRGRHYHQIAASNTNIGSTRDSQILRDAFKKASADTKEEVDEEDPPVPPPRRRRLVSGREAASARRQVGEETKPDMDGEPELAPDVEAEVEPESEAQPEVEAAPPEPAGPTEEELAEQRLKERGEYLDMMPRGLKHFLSETGKLPRNLPTTPENKHRYTINNFRPIYIVRLVEIQPDCPPEKMDEPWMLNIYSAVFLHHDRLDTCRSLGWDTLPCTLDQRKMMWLQCGLTQKLSKECHWECAPPEILDTIPGLEYKVVEPPPNARFSNACNFRDVWHWQKQKFLDLPDDQVFWVRLRDFIAETTSDKAPQLKDLRITTSVCAHVDCVWDESKPGLQKITRTGKGEAKELYFENGVEKDPIPTQPDSNWFWLRQPIPH